LIESGKRFFTTAPLEEVRGIEREIYSGINRESSLSFVPLRTFSDLLGCFLQ
jgi:hypothetical protein